MGKADDDQVLTGMIEWDDAYFSTSTPKRLRKKLKRGKGSQKKSKVTVMVESFPLEIDGIAQRYCGQLKMKVGQSEQKTFTQQLVKSSNR